MDQDKMHAGLYRLAQVMTLFRTLTEAGCYENTSEGYRRKPGVTNEQIRIALGRVERTPEGKIIPSDEDLKAVESAPVPVTDMDPEQLEWHLA